MRSFYIIGGIVVIALALGAGLFFLGPASLQSDVSSALGSDSAVQVPFTVLSQGNDAISVPQRTNYRITSSDELQALWPMIYGSSSVPQIPTVDFTKYEVLAIFDGSHSTIGYGVSVQSVMDANAIRTVGIEHTIPGTTCSQTASASSPFEIIQVPITTFALAHQDSESTTTCP